ESRPRAAIVLPCLGPARFAGDVGKLAARYARTGQYWMPEHHDGASQYPNCSTSDASVTRTAVPRSTDKTSSGFPSFSISRLNTPPPHGCKAAVVVALTHR